MLNEPVTLTIVQQTPRVATCELCSAGPESLRVSVAIRDARGGAIQFAACSHCTAAMRRLIAAAGAATASGPAHLRLVPDDAPGPTSSAESFAPDAVGEPVLLHEFAEPLVGDDGQSYAVRVFGQGRADGTWLGWLTFVGSNGQTVRRTPRETTQSNQDHLAYWATGLEPSYLEGAFRRTS